MSANISFDLLMEDEMSFVEGCYRLPGENWKIFIIKRDEVEEPQVKIDAKWDSGCSGVVVRFPKTVKLNRITSLEVLSKALNVTTWSEVQGPDSMTLR